MLNLYSMQAASNHHSIVGITITAARRNEKSERWNLEHYRLYNISIQAVDLSSR